MSKKLKVQHALLVLCAAFASSALALAQEHDHEHSSAEKSPPREFSGDPYLLDTDPVTGKKLGPVKELVVIQHDGRELRFNGDESLRTFRADPAKVLAKVDSALIRQQLPHYPLETCPVSGGKLGGMGEPVNLVYKNRLIRFCCKGCEPKFLKDPGKFVAALDAAVVATQGSKYPLKTCLVSGEELGGEMGDPIDLVIGNRLVRLCCKGCKKQIVKDPLAYLGKLSAPGAKRGHGEKGHEHGHDDHGHGHDGR